jgi:MoaA/NifB/PqqE/SkfB family radical SAM enzyme
MLSTGEKLRREIPDQEVYMGTLHGDPASFSIHGLSFLWLEITAKCNLECVHCYSDSGPRRQLLGDMALADWLTILRDAASLGCRQAQFIGGEPTLHPDLARMISSASRQGYEFIEVYTNATHIGDQMLQVFIQYGVNVATSFYSDNPETHDTITKRRGSFERTVANLHRLLDAELPVRVGVIEMHENSGHGERARQFLEKVGVTDVKIDLQRGIGRAAKTAGENDLMGELCGECWRGKLCVTSSGSAYPCVFSRFAEVGSARDGVGLIVNDDRLINFRRALKDYQGSEVSRKKRHGAGAGCDPNCAPCEPTVFKCQPGCTPASCAPRSAGDADGRTDGLHVVGTTPGVRGNPACSPDTCSPVRVPLVRREILGVHPGRTHASPGWTPGTNGSRES